MTLSQLALSKTGAVSGAIPKEEAGADWNGVQFSAQTSHGAAMALARKLVVAGCPNQSWEAWSPEGQRLFFGPNLHSWATWTLTEGADTTLKRVPYVANPRFQAELAGKRLTNQ